MIDRLSQSGVRAHVSVGGKLADAGTVTLTSVSQGAQSTDAGRVYTVKADGTFHIVVEPGMYKLTVAAGGQSETREIMVGGERRDLVFNL